MMNNVCIRVWCVILFCVSMHAQSKQQFSQNFFLTVKKIDKQPELKHKTHYSRSQIIAIGMSSYLVYSLYALYSQDIPTYFFGSKIYYAAAIAGIAVKAMIYKTIAQLFLYAFVSDT